MKRRRYRCYADTAHLPHLWNVIGETWWCDGYLIYPSAWRNRRLARRYARGH